MAPAEGRHRVAAKVVATLVTSTPNLDSTASMATSNEALHAHGRWRREARSRRVALEGRGIGAWAARSTMSWGIQLTAWAAAKRSCGVTLLQREHPRTTWSVSKDARCMHEQRLVRRDCDSALGGQNMTTTERPSTYGDHDATGLNKPMGQLVVRRGALRDCPCQSKKVTSIIIFSEHCVAK